MSNPKKKKPVNSTAGRKGHQLPSRVSAVLWAILQAEAKKVERRSVAQTVIILLEEALRARGREVPSPDEEAE